MGRKHWVYIVCHQEGRESGLGIFPSSSSCFLCPGFSTGIKPNDFSEVLLVVLFYDFLP
jgi:hypothetical protein